MRRLLKELLFYIFDDATVHILFSFLGTYKWFIVSCCAMYGIYDYRKKWLKKQKSKRIW